MAPLAFLLLLIPSLLAGGTVKLHPTPLPAPGAFAPHVVFPSIPSVPNPAPQAAPPALAPAAPPAAAGGAAVPTSPVPVAAVVPAPPPAAAPPPVVLAPGPTGESHTNKGKHLGQLGGRDHDPHGQS